MLSVFLDLAIQIVRAENLAVCANCDKEDCSYISSSSHSLTHNAAATTALLHVIHPSHALKWSGLETRPVVSLNQLIAKDS